MDEEGGLAFAGILFVHFFYPGHRGMPFCLQTCQAPAGALVDDWSIHDEALAVRGLDFDNSTSSVMQFVLW